MSGAEDLGPASPVGSDKGSALGSQIADADVSDDEIADSRPASTNADSEKPDDDGDSGSDPDAGRSSTSSENKTKKKRRRLDSDSDGSQRELKDSSSIKKIESDSGDSDGDSDKLKSKKKSPNVSDDEDDNMSKDEEEPGGDVGDDSDKEQGEGLIADIFGDSSDEEADFQGFDESEIRKTQPVSEAELPEVSSDDEIVDDRAGKPHIVSDFDAMMAKKKEERSAGRRRKKNVDIINDSDDLIVDLLKRMKEAAEEDRMLNQNHQPAIKKLTMLPNVLKQLSKSELLSAFLDCGVLSAMTEWLAPLPDKSLPHLQIRESFLKLLSSFPAPHTDQLKSSGVGKAIMYLFKHPKELRKNRELCGRLINEWSRPIFGQAANFKAISREDRERRDLEQAPRGRRKSSDSATKKEEEEQRTLKPGDPGWINRARVPHPSNKDYVVRPQSNVEESAQATKGSNKKTVSRFEVQKRKFAEKKKQNKVMRAVQISIEGRNMSL